MSAAVVAAFDFDGTITKRDSLLPFLARLRGRRRLSVALALHGWSLVRMTAGLEERDTVKDRFLFGMLRDLPMDVVAEAAESYAEVLAGGPRLRPAVCERIEAHRRAGHRLVVISASPEVYVGPVARRLGFDDALATRLELDGAGRLTGRVDGANCRGIEKVRRLEAWLGDSEAKVVAYGDSAGDTELLARSDVPVRVRGRRALPPLLPA